MKRLLLIVVVLASCGERGALPERPPAATSSGATSAPTAASSPTVAPTSASALQATLVDVRTGEQFVLARLPGKVRVVQLMAVW